MEIARRNPLLLARTTSAALQVLQGRIARAQQVAMSGVDVQRPSDAPGRWQAIHSLSSGAADQSVYQSGIDSATTLFDVADSTLSTATSNVNRAIEVAIQMASDTYDGADRAAAAREIAFLREELLALSNTRVGDRSVFAGDDYHNPAFDAAGVWQGAAASTSVPIGSGEEMVIALDGQKIFQGTVDAFQVLTDLEAALNANDSTAIAATLPGLNTAHEQIVDGRQEVGFSQARVDDAQFVSENLAALLNERLSAAVGADPIETYQEFAALKTSYEGALQVTAAVASTNLFQMLR